jgi:hypothetical protein
METDGADEVALIFENLNDEPQESTADQQA